MSGHSKWATTKHKKAAIDSKRSQMFSKLSNSIAIAARAGKDPTTNPALRDIIAKARSYNLPNDNIERAIKRGSGEIPGVVVSEYLIEAYGPEGVALLIRVITDNKNRTLGTIKSVLNNHNGRLAETGSVQWLFTESVCFAVARPIWQTHPNLAMSLIDAGATEIEDGPETVTILCPKQAAEKIRKLLVEQNIAHQSSLEYRPNNLINLSEGSAQQAINRLVEALEGCEETDEIYLNATF